MQIENSDRIAKGVIVMILGMILRNRQRIAKSQGTIIVCMLHWSVWHRSTVMVANIAESLLALHLVTSIDFINL